MKNEFNNYLIIKKEKISEIDSECIFLEHIKTKAKVCLIKNNNDNKVFNIAFRTPTNDSKGTPHIIEHSVLSGSRKYNVKDPFIELAKSSMNTFLNAMTFPDKTCYPVASCNMQDLKNIMDVYLDAVFFPNIYKDERIFLREGWRYELENREANIVINGVVYNEMKGIYSDPDSILEQEILKNLYPNSTYSYESGGDPEYIPSLTYDEFLNFHRKYYHPSNAYIFLYGNMDFEERLDYIDKEYLSKFDYKKIDSKIKLNDKKVIKESLAFYNVESNKDIQNKDYISINFRMNKKKTVLDSLIFEILLYYFIKREGAVIPKKLLESGFVVDCCANCEDQLKENFVSITINNANIKKKKDIISIIDDSLKKVYKEGFDKEVLDAAINRIEFVLKEKDSPYPEGLLLSLDSLQTLLYDEDPFAFLKYEKELKILKQQNLSSKNNLFSKTLKEKFIDNKNKNITCIVPKFGLREIKDSKLNIKLSKAKKQLNGVELDALVKFTKDFKQYQIEEDREEELNKIPVLSKNDIPKYKEILSYENSTNQDFNVLHIKPITKGIVYYSEMYKVSDLDLSLEELSFLGLVVVLLTKIDTKKYSYNELDKTIDNISGGMSFHLFHSENESFVAISLKCLDEKLKDCMDLLHEIRDNSLFNNDVNRLKQLVLEIKNECEDNILTKGHIVSYTRALSTNFNSLKMKDLASISGISFYFFIQEVYKILESKTKGDALKLPLLISKLNFVYKKFFENIKPTICISYDKAINVDKVLNNFVKEQKVTSLSKIPNNQLELIDVKKFIRKSSSEAFSTSSQVNYVSIADKINYDKSIRLLRTILQLDYLWNTVRMQGGAYGAMTDFKSSGVGFLASYRDPHIAETLERYKQAHSFISNINLSSRELEKRIISTISSFDNPLSKKDEFYANISAYFSKIDNTILNERRNSIMNMTNDKLKMLLNNVKDLIESNNICVIGSKTEIEKNKGIFENLIELNI